MATFCPSYLPLLSAAKASPITICAGKQMSLCTYCFPRRIASSRPISNGMALIPCVESAADMTRQNAWEVFGTSTTLSLRLSFVNFTGYGSANGFTSWTNFFSRPISTVSKKERTRIPKGPWISLSSTFKMSGVLPEISFIIRTISSDKYASWPQPKLTTCTYSRFSLCAAKIAEDNILAW